MNTTTSQTIGPFFHHGLKWAVDASVGIASDAPLLIIEGSVFDGAGASVVDAMVEAWVPAAAAESGTGMPGFRRSESVGGCFRLEFSGKPVPGEPLAYITVFARGLLRHQFSAVFLDSAPSAILDQVPQHRRATLIAHRDESTGIYRWDIYLQGEHETVFFDYC